MTSADDSVSSPRGGALPVAGIALPLFAATLFLSAFLLFSVQPFFTKMLLPRLGGSPGVWSVAMVFFQGMLLLGYAYAHTITRLFSMRTSAIIHAAVLAAAFLALPIAIPAGWETPPESGQAVWILGLFAVAVGAPFFAISANGALLQAWFSRSGHPHADDPYFLYGSSNIGSFASLILYIVLIEPLFSLPEQAALWTAGYGILSVLILGCAFVAITASAKRSPAIASRAAAIPIAAGDARLAALKWIALGFIPSGLLVAVTAHISLDVAAAPFLWVAPLALFLLTFVFAFRRQPIIPARLLQKIVPAFGALTIVSLYGGSALPIWASLAIHLGFFFVAALHCHTMLFAMRPPVERLTGFYLAMSFGGVLGGAFASLFAPFAFNWVAEYLLLIVATLALHPALRRISGQQLRQVLLAAVLVLLAIVAIRWIDVVAPDRQAPYLSIAVMVFAVLAAIAQVRSSKAYAMLLAALVPATFMQAYANTDLFHERSFFGIVRVVDVIDGHYRVMMHGSTLHGAEEVRDTTGATITASPEPLSYYQRAGGIAAAITAMQQRRGGAMAKVGAVGLGAGSVACYSKPGEAWTFFEIDQTVARAARNPDLFRFLSDCGPTIPIVIGDARLTLGHEQDGVYDLLLIDAFSSDSIPAHLMTREAVELYRSKLKPDGLLVFHISNRYLELESVLAAIAAQEGMAIRSGVFGKAIDGPIGAIMSRSQVAVMAADASMFGPINDDPRWSTPSASDTIAWTDDFSNIFTALLRRNFPR